MAKVNCVWVIASAELSPKGTYITSNNAFRNLQDASNALDRIIWLYIKEHGYAVQDEINTFAKTTIVMENASELKQLIITCTKTPLQ